MVDKQDPDLNRWVETWKEAGPRLEAIQREELRTFRYEAEVNDVCWASQVERQNDEGAK